MRASGPGGSGAEVFLAPGRRRWWLGPVVLAMLLVLTPVVEIVVLIAAVRQIGAWASLAVVVATTLLGVVVLTRQAPRTWRTLRDSLTPARLQQGRMPGRELLDGAVVLLGGALLLFPGVVTDVLGVLCLLPFVRPLIRGLLLRWVRHRAAAAAHRVTRPTPGPRGPGVVRGSVVEGTVLPDVELPDVELPDVELPDVELPDVDMPDVEQPDRKPPEA